MRHSPGCGSSVVIASLWVGGFLVNPLPAQGEVRLIGTARLAGDAIDQSGLTAELPGGGVPHNRLGGISAVEFTGPDDTYLLLADRGPGDGATPYRCRFHTMKIVVDPGRSPA